MSKVETTINTLKKFFLEGWIIQAGLSGKDSCAVVHCSMEALKLAREEDPACNGLLYICTTNTSLDNFEVHSFIMDLHQAARDYAEEYDLPVFTKEIQPTTFNLPAVEYVGRGKLLRTPKTSANGRDCAIGWKVAPAQKFAKELREKYQTDKVLAISGSRDAESTVRAANIAKRGESISVVTRTDLGFSLAPIKDWSLENIWSLIGDVEEDRIESFIDLHARKLRRIYASGNDGVCDVFSGDNPSKSKGCGSRFGCTLCSMVANDSSLESQIRTDEATYGYMADFLKLRKFMNDTLFDMERSRSLLGREVKHGQWLKVGYNQYSLEYRKELLRYMLTMDAKEQDRADKLGIEPKFRLITDEVIIAIQFHWSREGGERVPGEALQIFHDVHTYGNRYEIPETSDVPYSGKELDFASLNFISGSERMAYRYVDLDELATQFDSSFLGFRADRCEQELLGLHHAMIEGKYEYVTPFVETRSQSIDSDRIESFLYDFYFDLESSGFLTGEHGYDEVCPSVMLKLLLCEEIVTVRKGGLNRLHNDLLRAQMYNAIAKAKGTGCASLVEHIILARSISEADFEAKIAEASEAKQDDFQLALGF